MAEGTGVRVSTRPPLIGTSIVDEAQREVTASISREYVSRCSSASARLGNGLGEAAQGATQPAQGAAQLADASGQLSTGLRQAPGRAVRPTWRTTS
ncbi:hypothetical protein ACWDUL_37860 [Nocardia niigatensis]